MIFFVYFIKNKNKRLRKTIKMKNSKIVIFFNQVVFKLYIFDNILNSAILKLTTKSFIDKLLRLAKYLYAFTSLK